jgi:hypothetical protein
VSLDEAKAGSWTLGGAKIVPRRGSPSRSYGVGRSVIRLRGSIERALERRWLRILVLLALALLVAFLALHLVCSDHAVEAAVLMCVILPVLSGVAAWVTSVLVAFTRVAVMGRAPPCPRLTPARLRPALPVRSVPLRL